MGPSSTWLRGYAAECRTSRVEATRAGLKHYLGAREFVLELDHLQRLGADLS